MNEDVLAFVSYIRRSNGLVHPITGATLSDSERAFTIAELSSALSGMRRGSKTLRCCQAALKAESTGGRELILTLVNLAFSAGVYVTSWTLREFNHIRKKGPVVVKTMSCLRPISLSSDLAAAMEKVMVICEYVGNKECDSNEECGRQQDQ